MSCEQLDFDSLSDSQYVKECFYLYLNNEQIRAIDLLAKRKETSIIINYGYVFLNFITSIINFDKTKLLEISDDLRELERKCTEQTGWLESLKMKFRTQQQGQVHWKILIEDLDREIVLADVLLCLTALHFLESNYFKAICYLRRSYKIYTQIFKQIHELCNQYSFNDDSIDLDYSDQLTTAATSENEYSSVPLPTTTKFSLSNKFSKSQTALSGSLSSVYKTNVVKYLSKSYVLKFTAEECADDFRMFKAEILRLNGAICFGYGAIQMTFSFLSLQLKVMNYFGYNGDRNVALKCLHASKNSVDSRSVLSVILLLYYYLIFVPFYSMDNSDLTDEIAIATQILNENEQLDNSALFLYFSGRRQRLKKKIQYAIIHYDAAIRRKTIPRDLKVLIMQELGTCLLIQLNFHDAMHYFNELKASKFSRSYYAYLTSICHGALAGEEYNSAKNDLTKAISESSQKDGVVERFIMNRCKFILSDDDSNERIFSSFFWKMFCFEVMYLWGLLGSCNSDIILSIISICEKSENEHVIGLSFFITAACYKVLRDYANSLIFFEKCIQKCNDNFPNLTFLYIPAYCNYELGNLYMILGNDQKARNYFQNAQQYKNYDFEQRLRLKVSSFSSN